MKNILVIILFLSVAFVSNAQEEATSEMSPAPDGMSAQDVLDTYFEALGGLDKLKEVETIESKFSGTVMGQNLEIVQFKKIPGKLLVETSVGGNVMSRQLFNNGEASMSQMGSPMDVTDDMKASMAAETYAVSELGFEENGYEMELKGVTTVDEADAYVVAVTDPTGTETLLFYDVESGLKVQTTRIISSPQGEMEMATKISDYKEVSGIKFPHSISVPLNPQTTASLSIDEIKVNEPIEDTIFD